MLPHTVGLVVDMRHAKLLLCGIRRVIWQVDTRLDVYSCAVKKCLKVFDEKSSKLTYHTLYHARGPHKLPSGGSFHGPIRDRGGQRDLPPLQPIL